MSIQLHRVQGKSIAISHPLNHFTTPEKLFVALVLPLREDQREAWWSVANYRYLREEMYMTSDGLR